MTTERKSRSGTTRTYAERLAAGRPTVSVTLTTEDLAVLAGLSERHGLSRSAVISLAIRELAKKRRPTVD